MKTLIIILISIAAIACSKDNGSGAATDILEGLDRSGRYEFSGVQCIDINNQPTSSWSIPNYTETLVITNNNVVSTSIASNCTAEVTGRIVFSAGLFDLTKSKVTNATNGNCQQQIMMPTGLSPGSINTWYYPLKTFLDKSQVPYYVDKNYSHLIIYTSISDGTANGSCFYVYTKK